jgi:1-aminocyclopropane-1-carboxylate deaminase/D-cysteine desulfhydrase-like pyridoxal-dependent ACC family enzyme
MPAFNPFRDAESKPFTPPCTLDRTQLVNLHLHPRLPLAHLPTPLESLPRLSAALGGPRLWVKRDDCTGLALGGNKARKAEYLLGAAQAAGATVILTTAGVHSNYLRMMAAGARKAGMRAVLFMRGSGDEPIQGNLILNRITHAELRFIDIADPWSPATRALMDDAAAELAAQGERPYVIAVQNTHAPLAALGYVNAVLELYQQTLAQGCPANMLLTPCGSGVTQAGLILGAALLRWPLRVVGFASTPGTADAHRRRIGEIIAATAALLQVDVRVPDEAIEVVDEFAGPGYGVVTPGGASAMQLCGEQEGLILDPVYNGKAMHGCLTWIEQGRLTGDDTVIFLHTGGAPSVFSHAAELGELLTASNRTESAAG